MNTHEVGDLVQIKNGRFSGRIGIVMRIAKDGRYSVEMTGMRTRFLFHGSRIVNLDYVLSGYGYKR